MNLHIIFGPTASSKSKIAIELWEKFGYPVLSVDSRKVYKGANIGTNKYTALNFMKSHPDYVIGGFDFRTPDEDISVYIYQQYVYQWIFEQRNLIEKTGGLIIHGGTGLYLDAILEGRSLLSARDDALRKYLQDLSVDELQKRAEAANSVGFKMMNDSDKKNPRRLVRVIENAQSVKAAYNQTSTHPGFMLIQEMNKEWHIPQLSREELYPIINERVHTYFELGWTDEVARLLKQYGPDAPALKMMGYHQVVKFIMENPKWEQMMIDNVPQFQEMLAAIQHDHRKYAKRQQTWAKKYLTKTSAS